MNGINTCIISQNYENDEEMIWKRMGKCDKIATWVERVINSSKSVIKES